MSNIERHLQCPMRTALGNCDPIGGFCTSVNEPICEAFHRLYKPQDDWILCSERLPETIGEYLITALSNPHKNRIVSAGYYHSRFKEFGTYKANGSWEKWDVIAWMPLPEPWKGADE